MSFLFFPLLLAFGLSWDTEEFQVPGTPPKLESESAQGLSFPFRISLDCPPARTREYASKQEQRVCVDGLPQCVPCARRGARMCRASAGTIHTEALGQGVAPSSLRRRVHDCASMRPMTFTGDVVPGPDCVVFVHAASLSGWLW
uniref:Uncharacterized protein n=1 Tax=Eutreptiella gymnastica TaxID=73025 RepID=A0A7S1I028_9EUGL